MAVAVQEQIYCYSNRVVLGKDYSFLSISFLFRNMKRFKIKMIILTSWVLHFFLKAPPYKTVDGIGRVKVGEGEGSHM